MNTEKKLKCDGANIDICRYCKRLLFEGNIVNNNEDLQKTIDVQLKTEIKLEKDTESAVEQHVPKEKEELMYKAEAETSESPALHNIDETIIDSPDSQPLFTEVKEDMLNNRKEKPLTSNVEDSQSQSPLRTKRSGTESSAPKKKMRPISVPQRQETQIPREESALPSQNPVQENENYECVLCNNMSNQEDLRNEHFGKVISSELQFVEPCLRTYVYIEILKLIQRNKYVHIYGH